MEYARAKRQGQSTQPWNDTIRYGCRETRVRLARVVEDREDTPDKGEDIPARQCWGESGRRQSGAELWTAWRWAARERGALTFSFPARELEGGKKVAAFQER